MSRPANRVHYADPNVPRMCCKWHGEAAQDHEGNDKTYENEAVTLYWLEFYCGPTCALCGNTGIIMPAGRESAWCICPNGQAARHHLGGRGPYSVKPKPQPVPLAQADVVKT